MARRKRHPSAWVFLIFLTMIVDGAATDHWQEMLTGCSGITAMLSVWILFRNVVYCDVKRKNRPGFCEQRVKGTLFGCRDHYWEKVVAWSRYLGTAYVARMMHISLPILRWQAGVDLTPRAGAVALGMETKGVARTGHPSPGYARNDKEEYTPSISMQATSFYVTVFSGVATIAGLGLSIAQAVK